MSGKCDICGKQPSFGCNVSHSKRHTNRQWKPNIQRVKLSTISGTLVRLNACTRCMRTMSKTAS